MRPIAQKNSSRALTDFIRREFFPGRYINETLHDVMDGNAKKSLLRTLPEKSK